MKIDAESSFSRLPGGVRHKVKSKQSSAQPTRGQKAIEVLLFTVFGLTIALAGVALYATNRPEHRRVPNMFASGMHSDRVNVLLIGSSIRTRAEGGTQVNIESLMLLSVQPSTGRAALLSVPVDLWVKVGRYGKRPLRAAHTVGDASGYPGAGVGLTVDTLSDIIDEPIHAYARISIGDVQRLVDAVGGVNVNVTRGVYQYKTHQRFRRGTTHMNGQQASHYAFSRYIAGVAASDRFAREERQQEVVLAVLNKTLQSRRTFAELAENFGSLTATNLEPQQVDVLADALRRGKGDIRRISFAPYVDSFDVSSVAYRGEAVGPRNGNFATLQQIADAALDTGVARVH
jgi:LCP family protein required for cell wall assembly